MKLSPAVAVLLGAGALLVATSQARAAPRPERKPEDTRGLPPGGVVPYMAGPEAYGVRNLTQREADALASQREAETALSIAEGVLGMVGGLVPVIGSFADLGFSIKRQQESFKR